MPFDLSTAVSLSVSPEEQTQRDQKALVLLDKERSLDMPDASRVALEKDIANRGGAPKTGFDLSTAKLVDQPKSDVFEQGKRVAGNINELTDMVLGIPAQVLGVATELSRRVGGMLAGESRDVYTKRAQERGQQASALFDRPVAKLMNVLGYGEDYSTGDVKDVMGKVAGWIDTKGEGVEKATKGAIKKEDFQLLVNEAMAAGGVKGLQAAKGSMVKAVGDLKGLPPKENLPADAPYIGADELAKAGPQGAAAQTIKETLSIKTAAEAAAWRAKRLKDAKTAFTKEEPEAPLPDGSGRVAGSGVDYADYLKFVAEERTRTREQPKPSYTAAEPAENVYTVSEHQPAVNTTWNDALRTLKKPGFDRTAEERIMLRNYLRQSGMPTGVADTASAIVEGKDLPPLTTARATPFIDLEGRGVGEANAAHGDTIEKLLAARGTPLAREGLSSDELYGEMGPQAAAKMGLTYRLGGTERPGFAGDFVSGTEHMPLSDVTKAIEQHLAKTGDKAASLDYDGESFQIARRQQGMVDPKLLARLAALGVGGVIGAQIDPEHPLIAALIGGMVGHAATSNVESIASALSKGFPIKTTLVGATIGAFEGDEDSKFKSTLIGAGLGLGAGAALRSRGVDTRMRIDPVLNAYDHAIARTARSVMQLQLNVEKLVPKVEDRAAITYAMDSGRLDKLTAAQLTAANLLQNNFKAIGEQAKGAGLIENTLDNYITHLWGPEGQAAIEAMVDKRGGPNMSPETRFALKRKFSTLQEGKAAGLTPLSEDASAIAAYYSHAVGRALANRQLLKDLKGYKDAAGRPIILPAEKAPQGWVTVQNPQIVGMRVHPDIAPSLRFMFEAQEPSVLLKGISGVNTAVKRNAVSLSLFHAKALGEAMLAASRNPITAAKTIYSSALGTNVMLKQLREGGAGDLVDNALRDGVKFSMRRGALVDEDVGGSFYNTMEGIQKFADKMIPGGGKLVGVYTKLNHAVDTFMWERLHTGLKLNVYADRVEALTQSNAKAHAADPRVPLKSSQEIGEIAASFTNDTFGGLNWRRVAESAKTRWGRELAQGALSPAGRRILQLLMFAPDWTISTVRAATQAFGKGSGLKGIVRPQELADLHRQYMLRSALYYTVIGDALNYHMSGHHLWDNRNPFRIEMGDGRWLQLAKHATEPYEWLHQPGQQALNKLGTLPKEAATQLLGKEYLSTGNMPPMKSRLGHLATTLSPIGVQQAFEQGPQAGLASGIAGALGVPIYGKTNDQKYQEKLEKRMTPKVPDARKQLIKRMQKMQSEGLL